MDRETLVYVDLDRGPHLIGRLRARVRKNKESATFEYEDDFGEAKTAEASETVQARQGRAEQVFWQWRLRDAGRGDPPATRSASVLSTQ